MNKTGSSSNRRARRTRAQWSALVKQYGESTQTQTAFCASHDLPISSFTNALRRAREDGIDVSPASAFVELEVERIASITPSSAWDVELTLGTGMVLRIRRV